MKIYQTITGLIFLLVGLIHLIRVITDSSVIIEGYSMPMYFSYLVILLIAPIVVWSFRLK